MKYYNPYVLLLNYFFKCLFGVLYTLLTDFRNNVACFNSKRLWEAVVFARNLTQSTTASHS